ncbi:MAG: hypothetical protein ACE5K4_10340 [Candidatus Hydrothermarchaeota archaeon]
MVEITISGLSFSREMVEKNILVMGKVDYEASLKIYKKVGETGYDRIAFIGKRDLIKTLPCDLRISWREIKNDSIIVPIDYFEMSEFESLYHAAAGYHPSFEELKILERILNTLKEKGKNKAQDFQDIAEEILESEGGSAIEKIVIKLVGGATERLSCVLGDERGLEKMKGDIVIDATELPGTGQRAMLFTLASRIPASNLVVFFDRGEVLAETSPFISYDYTIFNELRRRNIFFFLIIESLEGIPKIILDQFRYHLVGRLKKFEVSILRDFYKMEAKLADIILDLPEGVFLLFKDNKFIDVVEV